MQIISRDRAGAYAEGARTGAPDAIQIADRFHLMCNLTPALQRIIERLVHAVQRIHATERTSSGADSAAARDDPVAAAADHPAVAPAPLNKHEHERRQRREKRKALFDQVHAAFQSGLTKRGVRAGSLEACWRGVSRAMDGMAQGWRGFWFRMTR